MKRTLIFLLLYCQLSNAQEILVPYRIGNKFGLSDLAGKLVVQPTYDWISASEYPRGYFSFNKGDKTGVIYNKKEIIVAGKDNDFAVLKNKFIIGKYREKFEPEKAYASAEARNLAKRSPLQIYTLYNLAGQNVYNDTFAKLTILDTLCASVKNKKNAKYTLFISGNQDGKQSIFVYDNEKQVIINWLIKDYEKLVIRRNSVFTTIDNSDFIAQKNSMSQEEELSFELVNNIVKMHSKVIEKSASSGDQLTNEGALYNSRRGIQGDPSVDITIEEPRGEPKIGSKARKYYTRFKVADDKIIFSKTDQYAKEITKDFALPFKADKVKPESLYFILPKSKDSLEYEINSVLSVEAGGKYGVFITDSLFINPIYDELKAIVSNIKNKRTLFFLVGIKDAQTNKTKYGTIDIFGKPIIPIIYDQISTDNEYSATGKRFVKDLYDQYFRVTKDRKSGYLTVKNEVKIPVEFDEIYKNELNYLNYKSEFMVLKKDSKYGLFKHEYNADIFIKPIFTKKIGYYIENYSDKLGLNLYALVEENAQLFCYASKEGILYYKEK